MMYIEKLPSGAWRATIRHGGRRHRVTAPTKDEVQLRAAELRVDLGLGPKRQTGTVDELLDLHLVEVELAATTRADYLRVLSRFRQTDPRPTILDTRVRDVDPLMVRSTYRNLARAGWSVHRQSRLHDVLSGAFKYAVTSLGWIRENPAKGAGPDAPNLPDLHVPTDTDVIALIAAAETDPTLAVAVRLSATIGTRRGETVAIQWPDVDLEAGRIRIHRSRSYTPASGVVDGRTKTGERGHRTPTVTSPALLVALRRLHASHAAVALAEGLTPRYVIALDPAGQEPWRPDRLTSEFVDLARRAGVACRLHDLRHYCATSLLSAGVAPAIVSGILGHASTSTTLRRYAHYVPGIDSGAADVMASKLG